MGKTGAVEHFWSRVDRSGECWIWLRAKSTGGYGRVYWAGRMEQAHRVAYELERGPIPSGLELDHLCHTRDEACPGGRSCRHRPCVNPSHLEPVVTTVNLMRGRGRAPENAAKTHCPAGHAYSKANTYWYQGARQCAKCRDAASRKQTAEKRKPPPSRLGICVWCGNPFEYVSHKVRNRCSAECAKAANRESAKLSARRARSSH